MNDYEKQLENSPIIAFVPGGDSMWPTLKHAGQSVFIERKPNERLKLYDVPFYKRANGQYVLHRIVEVRENDYVLCGDSQFTLEYGITDDMIIGVLKGYYKGKKYIDANSKKSKRLALFLRKHNFIKKVAVKVHFKLKSLKGKWSHEKRF